MGRDKRQNAIRDISGGEWGNTGRFTLTELLVVIGILMLLAAITLGVGSTLRRQSRESNTKALIKNIEVALDQYKSDHGQWPEVISDDVSDMSDDDYKELGKEVLVMDYEAAEPERLDDDGRVKDFWGNYIRIVKNGFNQPGLDIWSCGPDGEDDTTDNIGDEHKDTDDPDDHDDDVVNWTREGSW